MSETKETYEITETTETTEKPEPDTEPDTEPCVDMLHIAIIDDLKVRIGEIKSSEVWEPSPGENIIGQYLDCLESYVPTYGRKWQLLIRRADNEVIAVLVGKWMMKRLLDSQMRPDDYISIDYLGSKAPTCDSGFNAYRIILDKEGEPGLRIL